MTLLQGILSAITGIAVVFFLFNIHLAVRSRQKLYLALVAACAGMLIYIPCNILLYNTTDSAMYLRIVQVQMFGTAFFFVGIISTYVFFLQFPSRWPIYVYSAGFAVFLVARLSDPLVMYSRFDQMLPYSLLWGEQIWLPVTSSSLLGLLYVVMIFSTYIVISTIGVIQFRRGFRVRSTLGLVALALLFLMTMHDSVVYSLGLKWLFLGETGFILVISIIELSVAEDILRVNLLSEKNQQLTEELERRVIERTAQLEAVNQELEAFSYSISHDLRAPLRAINGFAQILEDDFSGELSPVARGFLGKIRAAGGKMGQLIDELLDFSRIGRKPLDRQEIDLNELVRLSIEVLAPEADSRQIEWVLTELPPAAVDPVLFQQVYTNLIGNAVKYTGKCAQARIEVGALAQSGETIYFVRDNGAGFDMQYVDKLFGVFQRLHRDDEFEGTGIGLATVKRIIERHGGRIWAEAAVAQGATFFFTLGV